MSPFECFQSRRVVSFWCKLSIILQPVSHMQWVMREKKSYSWSTQTTFASKQYHGSAISNDCPSQRKEDVTSSPLLHRDSPIFKLITRIVLGAHSLQGLLTQCMPRTLTGIVSTATGTVDPTTAGKPDTPLYMNIGLCKCEKTGRICMESHQNSHLKTSVSPINAIRDIWLVSILSSCLTVTHFPNQLL